MGAPPAVLILDDGELDDIHKLLEEMRVPCARVRGGAIVEGSPPPRDLLIATPRRIGAVQEAVGDALSPPVRVMVVNEDSNALRAQLRSHGFDYLVRRPVHTEALRLLLTHCLYKGEERRSEPRVAVGFEITFRTGLLTRRATLVDLSIRGCRLHSRTQLEPGRRIKVHIPEALDSGETVTLLGRVVRVDDDKDEAREGFGVGICFETLSEEHRQILEVLIEDRATGPATLHSGSDDVPRIGGADADSVASSARARVGASSRADAAPPPAHEETPLRATPDAATSAGGSLPEAPRLDSAPLASDVSAQSEPAGQDTSGPAQSQTERRRQRGSFSQTVPAFSDRALRVLVGRDLSVGGMRIEPIEDFAIGDRLHIAIYSDPGEEPLLIWGSVARDDGDGGQAVVFDALDADAEARLERLVTALPAFEALRDGEADAMGTVVTGIVD